MIAAKSTIEQTRLFRCNLLILWKHLNDGRILNIKRADAAHDLIIGQLADLLVFRPKGGKPETLCADLLLD